MNTAILQTLRYLTIIGAFCAAIYSIILARASDLFHQDTAISVAAAVHLQPHNAEYLDRLASWQTDDRQALLKRSIVENPFNYNAMIRLGLLAEMQDGDSASAEKYYLEAANVNHMFLPRWTLANFYFREHREDEFFHWSRETLAITPYASDPVFAQMWQMTQDEDTLNAAIPDRPRILLQYAWYLSNNKQYTSIPRTVERLVRAVGKDDPANWGRDDLLAVSEDHMLAAGYLQPALKVWATLKDAGWIDESVPTEQNPLTDGDFRVRSYRHGFDWVIIDNPGAHVEQFPDTPDMRVSLYGDEAEKITLMQQYVAVLPDRHYTMSWNVKTDDLSEPSGLAWHLHATGEGTFPDLVSGDLIDPNATWDFVSQSGAKTFLLTLDYARALGTTRAHGSFSLRGVAMTRK
jgi:tetratricopeptide (TPR) repeat protein